MDKDDPDAANGIETDPSAEWPDPTVKRLDLAVEWPDPSAERPDPSVEKPDPSAEWPDPVERPAPEPLPDDTWDTAPTSVRRAVRRHRGPRRSATVGLILAAIAVVLAVGVPLLLSGNGDADPLADRASETARGAAPSGATATPSGAQPSPTEALATTTSSAPATPAGALVYEAEAGGGSVHLRRAEVVTVDGASGGRAVRFTSGSGQIEFRSVQVPDEGQYRITVVYVHGGSWSGSVQAWRSWEPVPFEPGAGCCASVTVDVRLSPRSDQVTIELLRGDGPFPAIDRILVERA